MSGSPAPGDPANPRSRRWFVVLAVVTLIGFALFVGTITVLALKIPELKRARVGVLEGKAGDRHHQDERGGGNHPGGVAGVDLRFG